MRIRSVLLTATVGCTPAAAPPDVPWTAYGGNFGGGRYSELRDIGPGNVEHLVNTNRLAMIVRLIPRDQESGAVDDVSNNRRGGEFGRQEGTPFAMFRYPFVTPSGFPAPRRPERIERSRSVLRARELGGAAGNMTGTPDGEALGSVNLGGALIAGDLVFVGAARDGALRAFDIETGQLLWKGALPASGQAMPMTYRVDGRRFVVIAAGGDGKRLGTKTGDAVVAFALPVTTKRTK
jgi:quinoprotein glucose dehydrogenase